jgi:uncharacterized cofD-like protein
MKFSRAYGKWLSPGIGIKRWLLLAVLGVTALSFGVVLIFLSFVAVNPNPIPEPRWLESAFLIALGISAIAYGIYRFARALLAPYRVDKQDTVIDAVYSYIKRQKGMKVVAIGGGTGLPATLRAMKPYTSNITAVVTVADDGGSSGRLRRDLGVLPPGDLRNNIAALADDESLMTQLFQHRFNGGDLGGHAFGNLFISALASVTGSLETALIETGRVLNIQGRVFPATLDDVELVARVQTKDGTRNIHGESAITAAQGKIEEIGLQPRNADAFSGSVDAIMTADVVVLGPGSLYTSILPNLLVSGIQEALRATSALKIYVCNIAMQPGETDGYTVADHVRILEKYIGRGVFQLVLANDHYPRENAGSNTRYVMPAAQQDDILQRYTVWYTDLVDFERPWRHDPQKLAAAILRPSHIEKTIVSQTAELEMISS